MNGVIITRGRKVFDFGIMQVPRRRRKGLYVYDKKKKCFDIIAYFKDDKSAEKFQKIVDFLAEAE